MGAGKGATFFANDPRLAGVPFAPDPNVFFEMTVKKDFTFREAALGGSGTTTYVELPRVGVIAMVKIICAGTITTTLGGGTVTTTGLWPYGFLDSLRLSANAQADLWSVSGQDLNALRALRHPGFQASYDAVDTVPIGLGAGQAIADGANEFVLTWEVPIAIDQMSLIGAMWAQSSSSTLALNLRQAVTTDLLVAAGGATIDSITGTWYLQAKVFTVPLGGGDRPQLITPDLTRFHGFNASDHPFSAAGEIITDLVPTNGQLDRLLVQVAEAAPAGSVADEYLSADINADEINAIRVEYGGADKPLDYQPAHFLLMENVENYTEALPDSYLAFDFLYENPKRDVIIIPGVTDLRVVPTVGAGATIAAGARVHTVQETLYS